MGDIGVIVGPGSIGLIALQVVKGVGEVIAAARQEACAETININKSELLVCQLEEFCDG